MMSPFTIVFLLLLFSKPIFTTKISQPWPIKVDRVGTCCKHVSQNTNINNLRNLKQAIYNESDHLLSCLDNLTPSKSDSKVNIISMAALGTGQHKISEINLYRSYQQAVLYSYCEHKNYNCTFYNELQISSYEVEDFRWNKIILLIDILMKTDTNSSEYFVWIDSDAIVLDLGFSLDQMFELYPEAEFIASRDIKQGLINTGLFLIRNSKWSREFLNNWWLLADGRRDILCDQDAFDLLYLEYLRNDPSTKKKIQILPIDKLNSYPPAWKYQLESNQILHLMGESSLYRASTFRRGFQSICRARSGGILANQLGLSKEILIEHAMLVYKDEMQMNFIAFNSSGTLKDLNSLSIVTSHYVDLLTYISYNIDSLSKQLIITNSKNQFENEISYIRENVLYLTLFFIDEMKYQLSLSALNQQQEKRMNLLNDLLAFLQKGAELGNALFWSIFQSEKDSLASNKGFATIERLQEIANLTFTILNDLESKIDISSQSATDHMKALMNFNLANVYYLHATEMLGNASFIGPDQLTLPVLKKSLIETSLSSTIHYLNYSISLFESSLSKNIPFNQSSLINHSFQLEYSSALLLYSIAYCHHMVFNRQTDDLHLSLVEKNWNYLQTRLINHPSTWNSHDSESHAYQYSTLNKNFYEQIILSHYHSSICYSNFHKIQMSYSEISRARELILQLWNEFQENQSDPSSESFHLTKLLNDIQSVYQEIKSRLKSKETENISLELKTMTHTVDDKGNSIYKPVSESDKLIEDDYEWIECDEKKMEDCEPFEVIEQSHRIEEERKLDSSLPYTNLLLDNSLYDENISNEDLEEMLEIRRRHYKLMEKNENLPNLVDPINLDALSFQSDMTINEVDSLKAEIFHLKSKISILENKLQRVLNIINEPEK